MKLRLALIFFFILLIIQFVIAVPSLPLILNGNVTVNNEKASVGTIIVAKIDGIPIEEFKVIEEGKYSFAINDKNFKNKLVEFYVNNIKALQTTTFESGKVEIINLAVEKPSLLDKMGLKITGSVVGETKSSSVIVGILLIVVIVLIGLSVYFIFNRYGKKMR